MKIQLVKETEADGKIHAYVQVDGKFVSGTMVCIAMQDGVVSEKDLASAKLYYENVVANKGIFIKLVEVIKETEI